MALSKYTLRQFEAFLAVSETLGFRPAADRLGLTTSAVSQLIAEFETTLGFRLFDRTTRQVSLTPSGREFLPSAQAVLRHLRHAEIDAEAIRNHAAGLVKIAAPLAMACTLLPAAIRAFRQAHPKMVVSIVDTPDEALIERVRAGDADLAIGSRRGLDDDIECRPLFNSPWTLWCAPTHPLAQAHTVSWNSLTDMPLMTAFNHDEIDAVLNRHPRAHTHRVEVMGNLSTALGLSREGFAPTLAPAYVAIMADLMGLVKHAIVEPVLDCQVSLYAPKLRQLSAAAGTFCGFLENWMAHWHDRPLHDTAESSVRP